MPNTLTSVPGIEFATTHSYFDTTNGQAVGNYIGMTNIKQHAFAYEESQDESGITGQYLQVRLNDIGSSTFINEKTNAIIVSGWVAAEDSQNDSTGEDVVKFDHVFITNFRRYQNDTVHRLWSFEDQTPDNSQVTYPSAWSPSLTHSGWANGSNAVNGTYWEGTVAVRAWPCRSIGTPSGGTGPSGGTDPNNEFTPNSPLKYIYTEASGDRYKDDYVVRTDRITIPSIMLDTSNDIDLVFRYFNYSSTQGSNDRRQMRVYVDTSDTSNHSDADLIFDDIPSLTSTSTSPYFEEVISLNDYRTETNPIYIYIVLSKGNVSDTSTDYKNDLAIDHVQIIERGGDIKVKYDSNFTSEVASGPDGTLITSSSVEWQNSPDDSDPRYDPTIKFRLFSTKKLYVRGTYLLM